MFNLLFIFIFALISHNFVNGAQEKKISRKKEHTRQLAVESKDDLCITPIPVKTHPRKSVISLPYGIQPVTEDNLSTQDNALRRSAPILNNLEKIAPDDLSKRSLSEGSAMNFTPSTNSEKRRKSNPLSFKQFSGKKTPKTIPLAPISETFEHGFLSATRNLNIDLIKFYLSSNSFNPNKPRDEFGNTAFHIIAAKKTKLHSSTEEDTKDKIKTATTIIDIFLKDYRTDFSIVNNAGSTPRELFSSNLDIIFRQMSFLRCSLNTAVNKYAKKLKNAFSSGFISPEVIEEAAQHIIGELKDIEASQSQSKDRALPSESRLPVDLTIYSVEQMLLTRLNYITNDN